MAHRTARLNVFGRELLVNRALIEGWTVSTATRAQGISRATGYKWVRRFPIRRSSWPGRSQLAATPLSSSHVRPRGRADSSCQSRVALGSRQTRSTPGSSGLDSGRSSSSGQAPTPGRYRSTDGTTGPPLRSLSSGKPRPSGPQETGADPRRRRPSGSGPCKGWLAWLRHRPRSF